MSKQYKGSLSLEWFNKQKSILIQEANSTKSSSDIAAPKINWINKDEALFYEIVDAEGRGLAPYWVDRSDIRVKEARPLVFQKAFVAQAKGKKGALPGMDIEYKLTELDKDDSAIKNILIKGDNLLALNTLKKIFANKLDEEKIKCIYIDPPYNTERAFKDYDDNLEHSEWLTMMRDRLMIMKDLLRSDGYLFIQIDDKEYAYLTVLLGEIFGRDKTILKTISVKMAEPTGVKMASIIKKGTIPKLKEYIIIVAKTEIKGLKLDRIPKEKWDDEYKTIIINATEEEVETVKEIRDNEERSDDEVKKCDEIVGKWEYISLSDYYEKTKVPLNGQDEFKYNNAWRIFRTVATTDNVKEIADNKKGKIKGNLFSVITPQKKLYIILKKYNHEQAQPRIKILLADDYLTQHLGDFWADIKTTGLDNEGGVDLPQSKKPEKLIHRVIKMCTGENDIVMDCFAGSGTTMAVAHKMGRRWIGIEIGKHADTLCIPRLKSVLSGEDQSGISEPEKWKGGGSFKYYHLGDSIIKTSKDGKGDFNWQLGVEFIQDSLLSSYDYNKVEGVLPEQKSITKGSSNVPAIGLQKIGNKIRACVVSLNEPKGKHESMPDEEIKGIYKALKTKYSPHDITIFTNRGVDVSFDSKPEDLEIIKIPQAIFADLEK